LLGALPASADSVVIRAGENGVAIHERDNDHRVVHRNVVHRTVVHRSYVSCKTVKVRTKMPNGNVVIKVRQVC
jgi:hypothetical protein